ncbi:5,6-dimethylbenzimidazole synthase [Sandarakinorhabdus sp.]|uniref:5,6-dimethylbenzimidazole synthase n=1 Tax=Sandarakinorhabdus sp. TaxID=1916663 RepID=UPI0033409623
MYPVSAPSFDAEFRAALLTLFEWRRDVRQFRSDPLPPGLLAELLETAALAPSVGLSQPWRFIIVDDPARRAAVSDDFETCNVAALTGEAVDWAARYAGLKLAGLDQAPCHLAVFADSNPAQGGGLGRGTMPQTAVWSAVMAVHTLWLAARAAGLGVGWVSILDPNAVARILNVPAEWAFIGYFCIGWPQTEERTPELEREGWEQRQPPVIIQR